MKQIFARLKPQKISIKETYYYKAIIGDNRQVEFDRAEGEIKFEFVYDGRQTKNFKKDVEAQDPRGQAKRAVVGHLAILKAGNSTWQKNGYEGKTIPLTLDINKFKEKLESSQKSITRYSYKLTEPKDMPISLSEALVIDQEAIQEDSRIENKPSYYQFPVVSTTFRAPVTGNVVNIGNLSQDKIRTLIERGKDIDTKSILFLESEAGSEQILAFLLILAGSDEGGCLLIGVKPDGEIVGLDEEEDKALLTKIREAVLSPQLPIPIIKPIIQYITINNDKKKLGIVIVPPKLRERYEYEIYKEHDFNIRLDFTLDETLINELLAQPSNKKAAFVNKDMSEEKLAEIFTALANSGGGYVIFGGEIRQYDNEKLLTGIKFEDINKCEKRIAKVMALIRPTIDSYCRKNQILFRRQDANVWILIFEVSNSLPEVYSFRKQCWCWTRSTKKGEQFEPSPLSANETFDFIAHKYVHLLQKASNIGDPPELTFGYVKWPYMVFSISPDLSRPFSLNEDGYEHILPGSSLAYRAKDGNSYLPSKYDPQKGILEWHQVEFGKFHSSQFFETELRLPIQNPEILREHNSHGVELDFDRVKDLDGHFEISLGAKLLSGLEINYFDALGDKLSTSEQQAVISKQSVIIVEMTLRITDLFRIRRYFPYRSLEFEGVLPENARYNDVEQILEDCGLRIKEERNYGGLIRRGLPRLTRWTAESRTENGRLNVILELHNRWYDLVRQISYGERQDTFSNVPTGHIRIEIGGYAEGAEDKELTDLLNRLQWRLKERFRYVKMS